MPKPLVLRLSFNLFASIHFRQEPGSLNSFTGVFQNASVGGVAGRYPVIDATKVGKWTNCANDFRALVV
jgi:hypothetical protein